jgi:hypothetical protein
MRKTIAATTGLVVGAGVTGIGALTLPNPMYGSDAPFVLTRNVIFQTPGLGIGLSTNYAAGGSGAGQGAMAVAAQSSAKQNLAPMSRMINSEACGAFGGTNGSGLTAATGVVIGLDAVDIYGAVAAIDTPTNGGAVPVGGTLNGTADNSGTGMVYGGSPVAFANGNTHQTWKWVLALLYGGVDLSQPVNGSFAPDCNSTARRQLVNNWTFLFQQGGNNPVGICSDANHKAGGDGVNTPLWHAFRLDDNAGTSDVFSALIGLQSIPGIPAPSGTSNHGFGASPFCNAMNWDASSENNGGTFCNLNGPDQFVGPGGITDPRSACTFNYATMHNTCGAQGSGNHKMPPDAFYRAQCTPSGTFPCTAGHGCCTLPDLHGLSPSRKVMDDGSFTCTTNADCVSNALGTAFGGNGGNKAAIAYGRSPSILGLGTTTHLPDIAVDSASGGTLRAADVFPTSFQDNDPIRRPVLGNVNLTGVSNGCDVFHSAEQVSNTDGALGLVLSITSSSFITDATETPAGMVQYPTSSCSGTAGITAVAPKVYNCAPFATSTHSAECPNGDNNFGGGCALPDQSGSIDNMQCLAARGKSVANVNRLALGGGYDARTHNMFMVDNNTTGFAHFVQFTYLPGRASIDFLGGIYRLHSMNTIFDMNLNGGNPTNVGCQMADATDQIACLLQADPCSIGYAASGGYTWGTRPNGMTGATQTAIGDCFVSAALCSGPPYTGANCPACLQSQGQSTIGNCGPASASGGVGSAAGSDAIRLDQIYPTSTTVTALGQQAFEYALGRKLYFNTAAGFPALLTTTSGDPNVAGELAMAQFASSEGSISPLLSSTGYFALANQGDAGWNNPFCEDFNEQTVCQRSTNRNACPDNNNSGLVPGFTGGAPIPSFGSVCGNGVQEPFEECDNGTANGTAGNACSVTCRCSATFHYSRSGSVFACRAQ